MSQNVTCSTLQTHDTPASHHSCNWRRLGLHTYIKILIIGGLFYCLYHNEIRNIVHKWCTDSSWSHGFLIPLFSLYFINQRKTEILTLQTRPNYLGLFFMICGIIFYPLNAVHFHIGYLQPIGMIATLAAIVLFLGGWPLVRCTWLPIVFLVFAVPLPDRYYVGLTMPLRLFSAKVAVIFMNLVNDLDATANGVVIDVVYKGHRFEPPLNVAEACSGMRLLMAFLALGVAMAYLHYRPFWQRLILLVSTVPIAVFCNIIRVTISGFIYVLINPKYAQGIYHDMLGLLMLPLAFGIYGFIAWFMSSLFISETGVIRENVIIRRNKA